MMSDYWHSRILMRLPGGKASKINYSGPRGVVAATFNSADVSGINLEKGNPVWVDNIGSELQEFEGTAKPKTEERLVIQSVSHNENGPNTTTVTAAPEGYQQKPLIGELTQD